MPGGAGVTVAPGLRARAAGWRARRRHGHLVRAGRFYRPELDALRFFAFLLVFCDHVPFKAAWFSPIRDAGGFGVAIFFCLSAYLIVWLLLEERERTGTVDLGAFAIRRVLRIWPLYLVLIVAGYVIGVVWPNARLENHFLMALLLMYANVYIERLGWVRAGAISPVWSISVEEQFYLAIPVLMRLGGRRAVAVACAVTIAGSYITIVVLGMRHAVPMWQVWTNSLVQFQFFALGAGIALLVRGGTVRLERWMRWTLGASGMALFLFAAVVCGLRSYDPVPVGRLLGGYLAEFAGTAAIFFAALGIQHAPGALRYLGKISYGLYMYHYPMMWVVFRRNESAAAGRHPGWALLGVAAGTVALAALSYEFFERPILRWKRRFEVIQTRVP